MINRHQPPMTYVWAQFTLLLVTLVLPIRDLSSQSFTLLYDGKQINQNALQSSEYFAVVDGGIAFFTGWDDVHGAELWTTDGTPDGTGMVVELTPGVNTQSGIGLLTPYQGLCLFTFDHPDTGQEVWRSNGTGGGTHITRDIRPGNLTSAPRALAATANYVFFGAADGVHGLEPWRSDGSFAGTQMVKDVFEGNNPSFSTIGVGFNDLYVFEGRDGVNGYELWRTDGADANTVMITDLSPGNTQTVFNNFANAGRLLFFQHDNVDIQQKRMFRTNATPNGTWAVDVFQEGESLDPQNPPVAAGGRCYYVKRVAGSDRELWVSGGGLMDGRHLKDVYPGPTSAAFAELTEANGLLFFIATDPVHGRELWVSNGSEAGTKVLFDSNPGPANGSVGQLVSGGRFLYFIAPHPTIPLKLAVWRTAGTPETTSVVVDITPGGTPKLLQLVNDQLMIQFSSDKLYALSLPHLKPGRPELAEPLDGAGLETPNPTLRWHSSEFARTYDVYLWKEGDWTFLFADESALFVTVPYTLIPGDVYHWRVVAKNFNGSSTSETRSFQIVDIGQPVPVSPPNQTHFWDRIASNELVWLAVPNATSYEVYFWENGKNKGYPIDTVTDTKWSAPMNDERSYRWQIVARNAGLSNPGPVWVFSTYERRLDLAAKNHILGLITLMGDEADKVDVDGGGVTVADYLRWYAFIFQ